MKKTIFIILPVFTLLLLGYRKADTINQYILSNTSTINDWSALDSLIVGKRLIILGEAGHGDGATFEKKGEFIEYLHQKHRFNVIGLEMVGFGDDYWWLMQNESGKKYPVMIIYTPMFQVSEMDKMLDLVSSNQMKLLGFDTYIKFSLWQFKLLRTYLKDSSFGITCLEKLEKITLLSYKQDLTQSDVREYAQNANCIISCIEDLAKNEHANPEKSYLYAYFIQSLKSLESSITYNYLTSKNDFELENAARILRDRQMAENIIWYLEHNPNEKLIINCASFHGARMLSSLTNPKYPELYKEYLPTGYYLSEYLHDDMLTIAFTSYSGYCQEWWADSMPTAIPYYENTIETLLHKTYPNENMLYFNLTPLRGTGISFNSSALGYTNIPGNWAQCFDGFIYLKEQKAPKKKEE